MNNQNQFYCTLRFQNILTRQVHIKIPCWLANSVMEFWFPTQQRLLIHTHSKSQYFTTQIVLKRSGDSVRCETRASKATVWSQSGDSFSTCWITTKYLRRKRFQEKWHNQEKISYCLSRPITDTLKSMFQTARRQGPSLGASISLNIL